MVMAATVTVMVNGDDGDDDDDDNNERMIRDVLYTQAETKKCTVEKLN